MNEVKTIADNNKRELVRQLGLLEEVFNLLGVVVVAFSTDVLYFTDLAGAGGCLDILEVDLRIFNKIHNRTEIAVQAYGMNISKRQSSTIKSKYLRRS